MNDLAPIVLFVYNRPYHTLKTIETLKANMLAKQSELIIFSDGPKNDTDAQNVNKVRKVISKINGFKNIDIRLSDSNRGLANSIIQGVTEVIKIHKKVIVLEDDLITSPYFLKYMNDALNFYQEKYNIWSISGYTPVIEIPKEYSKDLYITPRGCSWGWATWNDRWTTIDWEIKFYKEFINDKKKVKEFNKGGNDMTMMLKDQMNGYIDSWAIRWCFNQFIQKKYTIYPTVTFVKNIGFDNSATHGSFKKNKEFDLINDYKINFTHDLSVDKKILGSFANHYKLEIYNYLGFILKKVGLYKTVKKQLKKIAK
ncbi:MAG: glycosyltransferase [Heyndrickxia oleronia]|uniref:glycosyltransferase n=1 Tax=Heyndrickxia oleronia TaxID=38875 RepID=UPI00242BE948|nr:glycosyltransferase [Heyndrickxia oleronia]MCI1593395.1 glycosyltransferase [Heyndrickxia oleronia]